MNATAEQIDIREAVELAAVDSEFYGRFFFPKTFRQPSPSFHKDIWHALEDPQNRHVAIKVYRDGAKTSLLRTFTSKRIAYGISHTILFVSETQDHAIRSTDWIRKAVMYNRLWADVFQLTPGDKWTGAEIEIRHGVDEYPIRLIALGITGQTRGVNIDDYRPDLIVVDDPCDEENTATPEQRKKISDLFFGALEKSLAPRSECYDATMALLQTPLNREDLIESCSKDRQFKYLEFSCFDENGRSRWPQRRATEELLADKQAHIDRNRLSLWLREMEVKVVSEETASFRLEWLQHWDLVPDSGVTYIGIDPTPPPKEATSAINPKLDDAAIVVIKYYEGKVYLLDYYVTKSPNPDEFVSKIFQFVIDYKPMKVGLETILFARTTKTLIEREMHNRAKFFTITGVEDKRKKSIRIRQAITARASNRTIYVNPRLHSEFIQQYAEYPDVNHDDILDAFAIALEMINPALDSTAIEGEYQRLADEERKLPDLAGWESL